MKSPPYRRRGQSAPRAKFTNEQVAEIRKKHIDGAKDAELAQEYGVHRTTISRLVSGTHYADAPYQSMYERSLLTEPPP